MNIFEIKYYYKSAFRNGRSNDWDYIQTETIKLDLSENASESEIRDSWQNKNGVGSQLAFVSAKLKNNLEKKL